MRSTSAAAGSLPEVWGILNVTPDSFSDGGEHATVRAAVEHARRMVADGADIVDVGGESTRPGARAVPPAEEQERILPVIEALLTEDVVVSVDTRHAATARAALALGPVIVNDVSGLAHVSSSAVGGPQPCMMRLIASERVDGSRSWPRTAEVTVFAPGLRTPRMDMHMCSASTTTIAPRGARCSMSASTTCVVSRSCTCGRRAYSSTRRASLDSPVTRPSAEGM